MNGIPASIWTLVIGIVVTLVSFWVGQHHGLLPEQASEQAPLVDSLFNVMVTISTALFILVEGVIVLFAIQFRRRKGDDSDGPHVEGNVTLEAFWTLIPAVVVIGLGVYSVSVYEQMGGFGLAGGHHMTMRLAEAPPTHTQLASDLGESGTIRPNLPKYGIGASPDQEGIPADLVVNVTGMQYAWIFEYPNSGVTSAELHIPVDTDVQLNLSAQDVIHSFWVPQFRLKQDAIPGQPTQLRFTATREGTYPVVCAELCGGYHGSMRTTVTVEDPIAFERWQRENLVAQSEAAHTIALGSGSAIVDGYARDLGIETIHPLHHHHGVG